MRTWRRILAVGALVAAFGAPVGAAHATGFFGPLVITCAGDQIRGTVEVTATDATTVVLSLLVQSPPSGVLVPSGRTQTLHATVGTHTYDFGIGAGGLSGVTAYQVQGTTTTDTTRSNVIDAIECGPGEQIPEVPVALLLPLVALALVVFFGVRQRRTPTPVA